MTKKTFANTREYAMQLSQLVQTIEETGSNVADYFDKIRVAIDQDKVKSMSKAEFADISAEFNDVVEVYKKMSDDLDKMNVPVRLIGIHKTMRKTFRDYYNETIVMDNSLDVNNKTVDEESFNESEKNQDKLIEEFMKQVRRAFQIIM